MGKRKYYCEYCDKSFQDNRQSRRRHLNGMSHQRCKNSYFNLHMAPSESEKGASLLRSTLSGPEILHLWVQDHPEVVEQFKSVGGILEDTSPMVKTSPEPYLGTSPLFPSPVPMLPPPPAPILTTPPTAFAPPPVLLQPPQTFAAPPIPVHPVQSNSFSRHLPTLR